MSRGLGKIERKILEYIKASNCEKGNESVGTKELCLYIEGKIKKERREQRILDFDDYSESTYQSVLRATKSLERKGYIDRNKKTVDFSFEDHEPTWFMTYSLSV